MRFCVVEGVGGDCWRAVVVKVEEVDGVRVLVIEDVGRRTARWRVEVSFAILVGGVISSSCGFVEDRKGRF